MVPHLWLGMYRHVLYRWKAGKTYRLISLSVYQSETVGSDKKDFGADNESNFQSIKVLSTIYAWSEDINPLDDFPLLHISMTQQKLSSKTIFSTCNSFSWDLRFSSIYIWFITWNSENVDNVTEWIQLLHNIYDGFIYIMFHGFHCLCTLFIFISSTIILLCLKIIIIQVPFY